MLISTNIIILLLILLQEEIILDADRDKHSSTTMPAGNDLQDWFRSLPMLSRYWFGGTVLFTLLGRFGLLSARWLVLAWQPLFHSFQVWRPATALLYYPLTPQTGFHFLINLYFLYNYR
jgi:derlin-1